MIAPNMKHQEFFILQITIIYQNGQMLKNYTPNYNYLPKWADAEKLTLLPSVKIINYRIKHKNNDNLKPEDINIDTMIDNVKNKK